MKMAPSKNLVNQSKKPSIHLVCTQKYLVKSHMIHDNNDNDDEKYKILEKYYTKLCKTYFERDIAPFELNISHEMREIFSKDFM